MHARRIWGFFKVVLMPVRPYHCSDRGRQGDERCCETALKIELCSQNHSSRLFMCSASSYLPSLQTAQSTLKVVWLCDEGSHRGCGPPWRRRFGETDALSRPVP